MLYTRNTTISFYWIVIFHIHWKLHFFRESRLSTVWQGQSNKMECEILSTSLICECDAYKGICSLSACRCRSAPTAFRQDYLPMHACWRHIHIHDVQRNIYLSRKRNAPNSCQCDKLRALFLRFLIFRKCSPEAHVIIECFNVTHFRVFFLLGSCQRVPN